MSKKYKLPKYMWRDGKSKFFSIRIRQEGILPISWNGASSHDSAMSQLHRKCITQVASLNA